MTWRALTLGERDPTTGWRTKAFTESTIEMIIIPEGSSFNMLGVGYFARQNSLGFTDSAVQIGDEIKDGDGTYYEIETCEKVKIGNQLVCYKSQLHELPLHE